MQQLIGDFVVVSAINSLLESPMLILPDQDMVLRWRSILVHHGLEMKRRMDVRAPLIITILEAFFSPDRHWSHNALKHFW